MNKYLILFICFMVSLFIVTYEDNIDLRDSFNNEESVNVFYEIDSNTNIVDNPDTRDINIYVYFVIAFYSLISVIISFSSIKKINRYILKN
jgi:hypothetical protein